MTHRQFISIQAQILRDTRAAQNVRDKAISARIAARNRRGKYAVTCSCTTCSNAAPVLRPAFVLRAAILLAIGAASASGVGSILGFIVGSL